MHFLQPYENKKSGQQHGKISNLQSDQVADIHCHILPAIDDGPETLGKALAMAAAAAQSGTDIIIATPHFSSQFREINASMIQEACTMLTNGLKQQEICLTVLPGAEIRLEYDTAIRLSKGMLPSLANTDQYYLFELPDLFIPDAVLKIFRQMIDLGITPVLAHPERNKTLMKKTAILAELESIGVELQITGSSLTGRFGSLPEKAATQILKAGKATYVASDGHDIRDRKPTLFPIHKILKKLVGKAKAFEIMFENPHKIISHTPLCKNSKNNKSAITQA